MSLLKAMIDEKTKLLDTTTHDNRRGAYRSRRVLPASVVTVARHTSTEAHQSKHMMDAARFRSSVGKRNELGGHCFEAVAATVTA